MKDWSSKPGRLSPPAIPAGKAEAQGFAGGEVKERDGLAEIDQSGEARGGVLEKAGGQERVEETGAEGCGRVHGEGGIWLGWRGAVIP